MAAIPAPVEVSATPAVAATATPIATATPLATAAPIATATATAPATTVPATATPSPLELATNPHLAATPKPLPKPGASDGGGGATPFAGKLGAGATPTSTGNIHLPRRFAVAAPSTALGGHPVQGTPTYGQHLPDSWRQLERI